ncbi:MAG TPA: DoxX family protein [Thermoguttaceae bacterium]|nr:DoxX family protein [Thermoguttaceae bacterium]
MSKSQLAAAALVRIAIGWHFAYEGLWKVLNPDQWTSAGYLRSAEGPLATMFHWMVADDSVLRIVDLANAWGLTLIGVALMLGCLTRLTAISGIVLLALYYMAHPPWFAAQPGVVEGHYLIVNKNLIELLALGLIVAMPARPLGLDGLVELWRGRRPKSTSEPTGTAAADPLPPLASSRRRMLAGLVGLPVLGGFAMAVLKKTRGYRSEEESQLTAELDAETSPSMKPLMFETLDDLKAKIPPAKIKDVEFGRVILGGNLMNGFAHARDLIYVSNLIKSYHEEWRVHQTFQLAEACGIDTILTNPILAPRIVSYREKVGGKIKFISQCKGKTEKDLLEVVQYSIDNGATAAYIQGMSADDYVRNGHFDWIASALQMMRDAGIPAGIGGHYIDTIKGCVREGFEPDFWVKTLHHHDYWSSDKENQHDNIWCEDPQQTIDFMETLEAPWIAFKVLAAGSIHPKDGFRYAFENGADFICVGMYDFQVVEDANIAMDILGAKDKLNRRRPWYA